MVLFWKDSINAWEEVPTLFQPKVSTASIKKKKKRSLSLFSESHECQTEQAWSHFSLSSVASSWDSISAILQW